MKIFNDVTLGVQSWCYRDFRGSTELIRLLKESGLDTLEVCAVHCDFNNVEASRIFADEIKAAGMKINSFGIEGYNTDETSFRNRMEFAKYCGIKAVGADIDVDAIPLAEKLCDEYSVKLAIHNHGRFHRYGSIAQLKEIFSKCSDNIGLCLDTGWALDCKEDPLDYIEAFSDRLYGVHLKDFNFNEKDEPLETVLGTGRLALSTVIDRLREMNFNGYTSLEYEGDASDPAPKLKKCAENLKNILK